MINDAENPNNNEIKTEHILDEKQESITEIDYKTLYLRTNADFQNFKRRTEKERIELAPLIQANVLEKILPAVDDLERAIQTAEKQSNEDNTAWVEGFKLILKNLKKTLTDLGVEEITTVGTFNPEFHEALIHIESQEHNSGEIVQELSKGYSLKGKILRHARVSVAK